MLKIQHKFTILTRIIFNTNIKYFLLCMDAFYFRRDLFRRDFFHCSYFTFPSYI